MAAEGRLEMQPSTQVTSLALRYSARGSCIRLLLAAVAVAYLGLADQLRAESAVFTGDVTPPPGFTVVEGDVLVPASNISGTYRGLLWFGGNVPFVFDANVNDLNRQRMRAAMGEWEAVSGVRFVPRSVEPNYILIKDNNGNSAAVGMAGGEQPVNIHDWDQKFVIVHELGHTLGLWHEQSRQDRETACGGSPCIIINSQNISQDACSGTPCNFAFAMRPRPGGEYGDYDFDSVMHYSQCAFSINPTCPIGGGETITVPPPNEAWQSRIGQLTHLSEGDAATMSFLYGSTRVCPGQIVATDPQRLNIDARQPSNADGSDPTGWDRIRLTFDNDPSSLVAADFAVGSTLGAQPQISAVVPEGNSLTVVLDRPITPGAWTTLIPKPCGHGVQVGYLPADVSQDGVSAPSDILALIDCLNGVKICADFATDIDRSGVSGPPDILQVIDLLNGAGVFSRWLNRTLPTDPDVWVESVRPPVGLIGIPVAGEYFVTVCRNDEGPQDIFVPLGITVGDPPVTFNTLESVVLSRSSCQTKSVFVPTPDVGFTCGGATQFPVLACANLPLDAARANDCMSSHVNVASAFWDLAYEIVQGPPTGCLGAPVSWVVRVTNNGNVVSPPVSSRTAICAGQREDYTTCIADTVLPFVVPALRPGESWRPLFPFSITPLPGAFRDQFIKAGVNPFADDPFAENNDACSNGNQVDQGITINQPNVAVTHIAVPDNVIGGIGPRTYGVTVENMGFCGANGVAVQVCLAGNCATCNVNVPALSTASCAVNLLTPPSFGGCGQINNFTVTACSLFPDPTPSNDCVSATVLIEVPYWDLHVRILQAPGEAFRNTSFPVQVQVENLGNVRSEPRCLRVGVCFNNNCGDYFTCAGILNGFPIPQVEPGAAVVRTPTYFLQGGAAVGPQYLKVGIDNFACFEDGCFAGNNDCRVIQVR